MSSSVSPAGDENWFQKPQRCCYDAASGVDPCGRTSRNTTAVTSAATTTRAALTVAVRTTASVNASRARDHAGWPHRAGQQRRQQRDKHVADQRECRGRQRRRSHAKDGPRDQHRRRKRERGKYAGRSERRGARQEQPTTPGPVAQHSHRDQRPGDEKAVDGDTPEQLSAAGPGPR